MKTMQEIKMILTRHKGEIFERFKVKEMFVFGSYVKGENKKTSDIDILVEFAEPIGFFQFLELEEFLEQKLRQKVDLVSRKALKPRIGEHILREMVAI